MEPLVTICIPNYNKSIYVERTLESVFNQTYRNIMIIVIDDCSADNSESVIKEVLRRSPFPYVFLKNPVNEGVGYTAQKGADLASGKYFQILSSDDIILPHKIEHQVRLMEQAPENTAFIYSDIKVIDEEDKFIDKNYFEDIGFKGAALPSGNIYSELLLLNFIPALTTLIRLSHLHDAGGYDVNLKSEDWEMSLQLSRKYNVLYTDEVTAHYRVERNSLMHAGSTRAAVYSSFCKTLMKHAGQSAKLDKNIYKNIRKFAAIIYCFNGKEAGYWLRKSLTTSFSFKNLAYFLANAAGIKYSFYSKLKRSK